MQRKKMIIFGIVVVVLLLGGVLLINRSKSAQQAKEDTLPKNEVLPTIDSSVVVTLEADKKKQEVTLSVSHIPKGITKIEYELSYDADVDGQSVQRGAIGDIDVTGSSITKKITLGTCSSGTCKYDKGVTSVKVSLRFQSEKGASIFEKEFGL